MKYVAVEGMTISYNVGGVPATASETLGPASLTVKADGKGVYAGNLQITVTSATDGSGATEGSGVGFFEPSSEFCTADGEKFLLEGDEASINVVGVKNGEPYPWVLTAKVQSAGQTSVKAE